MLLQEAAQPGSGLRHVRGLLQLLLADPQAGQVSGEAGPTAAMMAGMTGHVWSFDELFEAVLEAGYNEKARSGYCGLNSEPVGPCSVVLAW